MSSTVWNWVPGISVASAPVPSILRTMRGEPPCGVLNRSDCPSGVIAGSNSVRASVSVIRVDASRCRSSVHTSYVPVAGSARLSKAVCPEGDRRMSK